MVLALVRELHAKGSIDLEVFEVLENKYRGGEYDTGKISQRIRKIMKDPELNAKREQRQQVKDN